MRGDRLPQPLGGLGVEGRRLAPAMRLGGNRAGLSPQLQQSADPRRADTEPFGDLDVRLEAFVAGGEDAFT
jgi:hypothetical protein